MITDFQIILFPNDRLLKEWILLNAWFMYLVIASAIVILALLACFAESHQDCPVNVMLTGLFTFTASLAIGSTSSFTSLIYGGGSQSLNIIYFFDVTLIITFALVFSLVLYAFQTIYDFNVVNCIKYVVLIVTVFTAIYLILIIAWTYWLALFLPTVAYAASCALAFTLVSTESIDRP